MYLQNSLKNKHTIGKALRKLKGLRKTDSTAEIVAPSQQLLNYKKQLQSQGMKIGPLQVAMFRTKNGLRYPGFIAAEDIPAYSVLLRVPVDSLLTTRDAFLSPIQKVFQQNPKFYAKAFSSDWQDRVILTYLLYQFQRGSDSRWFHLLNNLPRDIDYVIFWQQKVLQLLEDPWIVNSIARERQRVVKEQDQLLKIAQKYPQFFDKKVFTRQNIQWIHVHLVTRCFGKYFEYTTMVPYAQLFNHQCTDVYYTMAYKPGNPHDPHQDLDQPKTLTDQQADQMASSDGSYDASDVSAQDQFFSDMELQPLLKGDSLVETQIRSIHAYIMAFISFNDGVSLSFLAQTYQQMSQAKNIKDAQMAKKIMQSVHSNNVRYVKLVKQFYNTLQYNKYSYGLKQKKKATVTAQQQIDPFRNYFEGCSKKDNFDEFLMVCGSKDQFQKGSQVYFCYGRLPNRLLLMRYGIALQYNKYNHLFVRIDITEFVQNSQPLRIALQEINFNKYRKIKVKRTKLCVQLLTFHRGLLWNYKEDIQNIFYISNIGREMEVVKMTANIFTSKLQAYQMTIEQLQGKLFDNKLGYHEYFAVVYQLEQQRILHQQLKMLQYASWVLQQLNQGIKIITILEKQTNLTFLQYQLMMKDYFKYFRIIN